MIIVAVTYMVFAYVAGNVEDRDYLQINYVVEAENCRFSAELLPSRAWLLWFNTYPAQIFMGDVGSLSLGAAVGTVCGCNETGGASCAGWVFCH